jgi:hypothetical protein
MRRLICAVFIFWSVFPSLSAEPRLISQKTQNMERFPGYFTFYWDQGAGKIWLEIDQLETEFLYQICLASGVGAFELQLDRSRTSGTKIVKFTRIGPKVLLIQMNSRFRAHSNDADVRTAVEDAFAKSVIWGFRVEAEESGRVLVDATDFFLRDAHNVIGILRRRDQSGYALDDSRSALFMPRTKNFPLNTEVEALLTFTSNEPGRAIRGVAPDAGSVSLRVHHSLVRLPDAGYRPRAFDPRSGFLETNFLDYASPIGESPMKRYIIRFRLQKRDPSASISDPVKPIIFYVERGAPEPIRSALMDGARWWNAAFEELGYRDAFQVKLLPEGADPMDIRYNVIFWIHRRSRGWSYAGMIWDPRTGEFLKANVVIESQRIRQDYLVAEGLVADYGEGQDASPAMEEMTLARIRQLSCHEVGHILGLDHNFASSVNDRASVMDYPHPLVKIMEDGSLDLSEAFTVGVGDWDKVAIAYGYQHFPPDVDEPEALRKILADARSRGLLLLTNRDTVPDSSPHPLTHRWDNGKHPVDELEHIMQVRAIALNNFSERKLRMDAPMATLEDVLVPIYLYHRYQIVAASKMLGGLYYGYSHRGDGQKNPEIASPSEQRRALDALLKAIQPGNLTIDKKLLNLIPPRPLGYPENPELFPGRTGLTFDPLGAAETVANLTISLILNPERAARLEDYTSRDNSYPGLAEVLDRLISATWRADELTGPEAAIQKVVNDVVLYHLFRLAADDQAAPEVRAVAAMTLDGLKSRLSLRINDTKDPSYRAHYFHALSQIGLFQTDPDKVKLTAPLALPKSPHNPPLGTNDR